MGKIVTLDGKQVDAEISRDDRPEDVLEKLLGEIRNGIVRPDRLMIIVEGEIKGGEAGYFTRTSLATNSEALALAVIAQRILVDGILDV